MKCEVHGVGLHTSNCDYGAKSMSAGSPASKEGGVSDGPGATDETNALRPGELDGLHQEPGILSTLAELYQCAVSWAPETRLLGNVRADDMARALLYATEAYRLLPASAERQLPTREFQVSPEGEATEVPTTKR